MNTYTYTFFHCNEDESIKEACQGFINAQTPEEAKTLLTQRYNYNFTSAEFPSHYNFIAKEKPTDTEARIFLYIAPYAKRRKRRTWQEYARELQV